MRADHCFRALFLASLWLLPACVAQRPAETTDVSTPRYLALGDSYTIGEGVPEEARWPVLLAGLLRASGAPLADPEIIARTGWTTDELEEGIAQAAPRGRYALVTLLIGVNNQYRGWPLAQYQEHFQRLLRAAADFAGGDPRRVVVLSIPDWGVTPFAAGRDRADIGRQIDAFNAAARRIAGAAGAHWVDVTGISRRDGAGVVDDGLHPSAEEYRLWAEAALPEASAANGAGTASR